MNFLFFIISIFLIDFEIVPSPLEIMMNCLKRLLCLFTQSWLLRNKVTDAAGQNKAGFDNDDINAYDDDKETRKSKKVHTSREIALKHWMDDDDDYYVKMLNMKITNEAVKFFSLLCGVCTMHSISIESLKQNIRDLIFM